MPAIFQQYRNENRYRRYPFADSATLTAKDGRRLPADFLVDAMLYVIDATGPIYLSSLDLASCAALFTDAATRRVCAAAQWLPGADRADVYDASGYERSAGVIVFGGSVEPETADGTELTFSPEATPLCPACCVPLRQTGVRGIVSGSDERLTAGHVRLAGRNGVRVKTYVDGAGRSVARVDIVGTPPPPVTDCDGGTLIGAVRVTVEECSPVLAGTPAAGILTLGGAPGFTLDDRCGKQRLPGENGELPGEADACADPGPAPAPFECPAASVVTPGLAGGTLFITAPSSLDGGNVVDVKSELVQGPAAFTPVDKPVGADETIARTKQAARSAQPAGRITLSLRGPAK